MTRRPHPGPTKHHIISVRLTDADYRRAHDMAVSEERPLTQLLRRLIRQALAQREHAHAATK